MQIWREKNFLLPLPVPIRVCDILKSCRGKKSLSEGGGGRKSRYSAVTREKSLSHFSADQISLLSTLKLEVPIPKKDSWEAPFSPLPILYWIFQPFLPNTISGHWLYFTSHSFFSRLHFWREPDWQRLLGYCPPQGVLRAAGDRGQRDPLGGVEVRRRSGPLAHHLTQEVVPGQGHHHPEGGQGEDRGDHHTQVRDLKLSRSMATLIDKGRRESPFFEEIDQEKKSLFDLWEGDFCGLERKKVEDDDLNNLWFDLLRTLVKREKISRTPSDSFLCRNCSSGEGIFAFYSQRAREVVQALHAVYRNQSVLHKPKQLQHQQRRRDLQMNGKKGGILSFLRRNNSASPASRGASASPPRQNGTGKKTTLAGGKLAKSVSVIEHLASEANPAAAAAEQLIEDEDTGGFGEAAQRTSTLTKSVSAATINCGKKKKSASESDLLSAGREQEIVTVTAPAPPTSEGVTQPPGVTSIGDGKQATTTNGGSSQEEGFYRSFDDIDDIDLGVLANSNSLEAAVVLRAQQPDNFGMAAEARCSFNSSDSGRMSDTYADTSNSSVTSNSSNSNRVYSNTSNCSGDSGTHCSMGSDYSSSGGPNREKALEVLKEQESPNYPPFDNDVYGQSISIACDHGRGPDELEKKAQEEAMYSQIDEAKSSVNPGYQQHHNRLSQRQDSSSTTTVAIPPPLPPRFATVRKSLTLPHNMNNMTRAASPTPSNSTYSNIYSSVSSRNGANKRKDLSMYFGLNDDGPGSPTREVTQMVALQNLPNVQDPNILNDKRKNLGQFLGIQTVTSNGCNAIQQELPLPTKSEHPSPFVGGSASSSSMTLPKTTTISSSKDTISFSTAPRSRPKSLGFAPLPTENNQTKSKLSNIRALNRTLFRLANSASVDGIQSAPTTPECAPGTLDDASDCSPRRRSLAKFLGLQSSSNSTSPKHHPQPLPPPPPVGILKKSALSNSTPMDLENLEDRECNSNLVSDTRWQSNDGLATPGSLQGGCTPSFLTPTASPSIRLKPEMASVPPPTSAAHYPKGEESIYCGPKQSSSMFSLTHTSTTPSSLDSPCHQQPFFPPRKPLQQPRSLQRGATLQATQPPKSLRRPTPPKREGSLPRSLTLGDLESKTLSTSIQRDESNGIRQQQQQQQPVLWVPRRANNTNPSSSSSSMQIRRHSLHFCQHHDPLKQQPPPNPRPPRRSHSSAASRNNNGILSQRGGQISDSGRFQADPPPESTLDPSPFQRNAFGRRSNRMSLENLPNLPPNRNGGSTSLYSTLDNRPHHCHEHIEGATSSGVRHASLTRSHSSSRCHCSKDLSKNHGDSDYLDMSQVRSSLLTNNTVKTTAIVHGDPSWAANTLNQSVYNDVYDQISADDFPPPPPPISSKNVGELEENIWGKKCNFCR